MYTDPDRAVYKALNMKENTENGPLSGEYINIEYTVHFILWASIPGEYLRKTSYKNLVYTVIYNGIRIA